MGTLSFTDSAYPLGHVVAGAQGIAFYIGGDTPHVWSKAEVDATPYRYRLPIFVRSNPPGPGAAADVAAAVRQLEAIGAPKGTLVAWDMETAADRAYMQAVYDGLRAAGWQLIVYASQSVIALEGNPDGLYWGAQWTGAAHIAGGDVMTQYVNLGGYDESAAQSALPLWDTQSANPPSLPVPGNPWPLQAGSNGASVVTLQQDLNAKGYAVPPLAADGAFGPLTLAAVRHAQQLLGMAVTGIVDQALWDALAGVKPPAAPAYPVPASLRVTSSVTTVLDWPAGSPVSPHWRVQVAADAHGVPGTVFPGGSVVVTAPHAAVTLPGPGRYWARVQAAGDSPFTAWQPFTA